MSEPTFTEDRVRFSALFTRSIIAWNEAGDSARSMLEGLSQASLGSIIAIRQLGNASLKDALLVLCKFLRSLENDLATEQASHIEHFVEGFDLLRVYRNFYVHNLRAMGPNDNGEFVGLLHAIEVKQQYSWVQQDLTMVDLREFTQQVDALRNYGDVIAKHVKPTNALLGVAQGLTPLSSLQKPIWPDRLKKNRANLLEPRLLPQSSPE